MQQVEATPPVARPDSGVLAAVDLGSNSFHMIVARISHGQVTIIDRLREMVRLAAGLDSDDDAAGNVDSSMRDSLVV